MSTLTTPPQRGPIPQEAVDKTVNHMKRLFTHPTQIGQCTRCEHTDVLANGLCPDCRDEIGPVADESAAPAFDPNRVKIVRPSLFAANRARAGLVEDSCIVCGKLVIEAHFTLHIVEHDHQLYAVAAEASPADDDQGIWPVCLVCLNCNPTLKTIAVQRDLDADRANEYTVLMADVNRAAADLVIDQPAAAPTTDPAPESKPTAEPTESIAPVVEASAEPASEPTGYMRPCEACNGDGTESNGDYVRPCSTCDGTGIYTEPEPIPVVEASEPEPAPEPEPADLVRLLSYESTDLNQLAHTQRELSKLLAAGWTVEKMTGDLLVTILVINTSALHPVTQPAPAAAPTPERRKFCQPPRKKMIKRTHPVTIIVDADGTDTQPAPSRTEALIDAFMNGLISEDELQNAQDEDLIKAGQIVFDNTISPFAAAHERLAERRFTNGTPD